MEVKDLTNRQYTQLVDRLLDAEAIATSTLQQRIADGSYKNLYWSRLRSVQAQNNEPFDRYLIEDALQTELVDQHDRPLRDDEEWDLHFNPA